MASCKNCGIEISVDEKKKYMGMCLTCILFQIDNKSIKPTRLFLKGTLFVAIGILGVIGTVTLTIIFEVLTFSDALGVIVYGGFLFCFLFVVLLGIWMVKRGVLIRKITHIRQSN